MRLSIRLLISFAFLATAVSVAAYVALAKPDLPEYIDARLRSIGVTSAPIGDITPARDLRGTWASSLSGKGVQLFGTGVSPQGGNVRVQAQADWILRVDSVEDNVATGAVRMLNYTSSGEVTGVPGVGTIAIPRQTLPDTEFQPVTFRVTGSALDFGSIAVGGAAATVQGSFTEDFITGWGGATLAGFDNVSVRTEIHLTRCSSRFHGLGCP
jgi:hypothetical protein